MEAAPLEEITVNIGDLEIPFGKHKGTKFRDLPNAYLFYIFTDFQKDSIWYDRAHEELKRRKRVTSHGEDVPLCTFEAVEQISKSISMLREFVQRTDKTQGIYAWSAALSREAIRHGEKRSDVMWLYINHRFIYDIIGRTKVLCGVKEYGEK